MQKMSEEEIRAHEEGNRFMDTLSDEEMALALKEGYFIWVHLEGFEPFIIRMRNKQRDKDEVDWLKNLKELINGYRRAKLLPNQ